MRQHTGFMVSGILAALAFSGCVKQRSYLDTQVKQDQDFDDSSQSTSPTWVVPINNGSKKASVQKMDGKTKSLIVESATMAFRLLLAQQKHLSEKNRPIENPSLRQVYRFSRKNFQRMTERINESLKQKNLPKSSLNAPELVSYRFSEPYMRFNFTVRAADTKTLTLSFDGSVSANGVTQDFDQAQSSHALRLLKMQARNWFRKLDSQYVESVQKSGDDLIQHSLEFKNSDSPSQTLDKLGDLLGNPSLVSFLNEISVEELVVSLLKDVFRSTTLGKEGKYSRFAIDLAYQADASKKKRRPIDSNYIWDSAYDAVHDLILEVKQNNSLLDSLISNGHFPANEEEGQTEEQKATIKSDTLALLTEAKRILNREDTTFQPSTEPSEIFVQIAFKTGKTKGLALEPGLEGIPLELEFEVEAKSIQDHTKLSLIEDTEMTLTYDPSYSPKVFEMQDVKNLFERLDQELLK